MVFVSMDIQSFFHGFTEGAVDYNFNNIIFKSLWTNSLLKKMSSILNHLTDEIQLERPSVNVFVKICVVFDKFIVPVCETGFHLFLQNVLYKCVLRIFIDYF